MEKVFITKKFTHCKTLRTLKIDGFEIPDNKNIGKLFLKYELLFLDQANSSSDPSQILILQIPIPRASLPLSTPQLNFILSNGTPLRYNPHQVLLWFPYFVLPNSSTRTYRYWIYQSICQVKPIKFIIKLYTRCRQKAEFLRVASLSKSSNSVNNNSIFNIQYAEFSTKW